jgi:hypothetical protein
MNSCLLLGDQGSGNNYSYIPLDLSIFP